MADDDYAFVDMVAHALSRALNASAEIAALKSVLAAKGIQIDPDEYAQALEQAKQKEIDKASAISSEVGAMARDSLYSR